MCIGVAYGAVAMTAISLVKGYDAATAALLFGDIILALSAGFFPMRAEMVRTARAESDGIQIEVAKRPVYLGLGVFFVIFTVLAVLEYAAFGNK